jgi:hypothetical protein
LPNNLKDSQNVVNYYIKFHDFVQTWVYIYSSLNLSSVVQFFLFQKKLVGNMVGYVEAKLAILKKFRTRVVKKSENQRKNLP